MEDDSDASNENSQHEGVVKKNIKKLGDGNAMKPGKVEDRNAWKKKNTTNRKSIAYRWRGFQQKIRYMFYRNTVYVLQCEDNKYYVGSTKNRKQRYREHFESLKGGSAWTRLHKPIRVIAEYKRIPNRYLMGVESQKTAESMMKYGVNNVRGAAYCNSREYTTSDIPNLTGFLGHYNQLDYQELYSELQKVLPRPYLPNLYEARNNNIRNDNSYRNSNNIVNDEEISKAKSRRKDRNYKRKQRKKRQVLRKKKAKKNEWASESPDDESLYNKIIANNQTKTTSRAAEDSSVNGSTSTPTETQKLGQKMKRTSEALGETEAPISQTFEKNRSECHNESNLDDWGI